MRGHGHWPPGARAAIEHAAGEGCDHFGLCLAAKLSGDLRPGRAGDLVVLGVAAQAVAVGDDGFALIEPAVASVGGSGDTGGI